MSRSQRGIARRPSFAAVREAFPSRKVVSREMLFEEIGIEALMHDPAYENTCAIRMSYALTKAGVVLRKGGLKFNKGPFAGRRIEPGMRKLSEHLVELWGPPQSFAVNAEAVDALTLQQGVVSFFFGEMLSAGAAQGHIDLLMPRWPGFEECANTCYFGSDKKIWFWPLP
ncbi:T6SS effector amidase Tae4 family protein [Pseudoduganella buxea]|uniref:Type VI secretion system amidase effector protein Tae4 n=1 Tax=Pseudoduganella buxea TaxID=1949069 RepID=A0A6I3SYD4_9BURK|nr:T6SS effector amidase Tae4 family protein [Pseudoduganella buxea]MTV53272.1 hypothetical protein [Pseudoduganella buxea]GGC13080.1 hypothetical protein GCM10011572_38100 [Pseudoduganella buxea]